MLTDEMKEAIEKNLPAQISTVLQDRLASVESLEGDIHVLQQQLVTAKGTIEEYRLAKTDLERRDSALSEAESLNETNRNAIEQRSTELGDEEHRVAMADLTAEMRAEQAKEMRSILSEVFHSPMYRKTVTVSGSHDKVNPEGGGYIQTTPIHHDETTTTEVHES